MTVSSIYIKKEMKDERLFLNYINSHYQELKNKYFKFCQEKQYDFDEDIYSDTILKCYDVIVKKGELKDKTPQGIENYFFKAFKNNTLNEQRYSRNKKRDRNISSESIETLYEEYYNRENTPAMNKVLKDLFQDFSVLYIMSVVEDNFDAESFYLYRIKTLCGLTFKELAEKTKIKSSRKKFIEVQRWLKENVTKDDIKKAFNKFYEENVEG